MDHFFDSLIVVGAIAFLGWIFLKRARPALAANNTVPYWYTATGNTPLKFDYASQSNYAMEEADHHGY